MPLVWTGLVMGSVALALAVVYRRTLTQHGHTAM